MVSYRPDAAGKTPFFEGPYMQQVREEGIVLRRVDYGETSAIVTLLTRHHGLVACMARGMRRKGKPGLSGVLDTLNRVECSFTLRESRSVQTLTEAALLDWRPAMRTDPVRIACGAVLAEAALQLGESGETETLFEVLENGLAALAAADTPQLPGLAAAGLLQLIHAAGIAPVLDCCADTGEPPDQARFLSPDLGLVRLQRGIPVARETALALAALARGNVIPDARTGLACLTALAGYTGMHTGRDLGSARVLAQMICAENKHENAL
ncbi:MAG TPA: DNA repair protein RecO [Candidatus Hydrogenedentes bacterium]|nr:DNA repair protein RecO [Candidatus Hydrogenedentota bacterium]HPU98439.1 DNA repair protein RecO [Candidatus Hydrogenedentota bacterium]